MEEHVLDPSEFGDAPGPARLADLRGRVLREAEARAGAHGVRLVAEAPRRPTDLAMLWFQGDRAAVLAAVGGWDPDADAVLRIAHAGHCGGRYELVLYAVAPHAHVHRAA